MSRVRIVKDFEEEPELLGMCGDGIRREDGSWTVFLDGDSMPTSFLSDEVEELIA